MWMPWAKSSPSFRQPLSRISVDQSVHKQKIRTQLGMIHRKRIHKGPISSLLLKPASIMQNPEKPGQIDIVTSQPQPLTYRLRIFCDTEGVEDFPVYIFQRLIIIFCVILKNGYCFNVIDHIFL